MMSLIAGARLGGTENDIAMSSSDCGSASSESTGRLGSASSGAQQQREGIETEDDEESGDLQSRLLRLRDHESSTLPSNPIHSAIYTQTHPYPQTLIPTQPAGNHHNNNNNNKDDMNNNLFTFFHSDDNHNQSVSRKRLRSDSEGERRSTSASGKPRKSNPAAPKIRKQSTSAGHSSSSRNSRNSRNSNNNSNNNNDKHEASAPLAAPQPRDTAAPSTQSLLIPSLPGAPHVPPSMVSSGSTAPAPAAAARTIKPFPPLPPNQPPQLGIVGNMNPTSSTPSPVALSKHNLQQHTTKSGGEGDRWLLSRHLKESLSCLSGSPGKRALTNEGGGNHGANDEEEAGDDDDVDEEDDGEQEADDPLASASQSSLGQAPDRRPRLTAAMMTSTPVVTTKVHMPDELPSKPVAGPLKQHSPRAKRVAEGSLGAKSGKEKTRAPARAKGKGKARSIEEAIMAVSQVVARDYPLSPEREQHSAKTRTGKSIGKGKGRGKAATTGTGFGTGTAAISAAAAAAAAASASPSKSPASGSPSKRVIPKAVMRQFLTNTAIHKSMEAEAGRNPAFDEATVVALVNSSSKAARVGKLVRSTGPVSAALPASDGPEGAVTDVGGDVDRVEHAHRMLHPPSDDDRSPITGSANDASGSAAARSEVPQTATAPTAGAFAPAPASATAQTADAIPSSLSGAPQALTQTPTLMQPQNQAQTQMQTQTQTQAQTQVSPATSNDNGAPPSPLSEVAVEGLQGKMFRYQLEGTQWLQGREDKKLLAPLFTQKRPASGHMIYHNVILSITTLARPPPALGGILADDKGLGKMVQTIGLLLSNGTRYPPATPPGGPAAPSLADMPDGGTLIVCPLMTLYQWKGELERCVHPSRKMTTYIYHGLDRSGLNTSLAKYDVVLTTYRTLSSEYSEGLKMTSDVEPSQLHNVRWFRVILDEAHIIRNKTAQQTRAVMALIRERSLALTSTPIVNRLDDIFSILSFVGISAIPSFEAWSRLISGPAESGNQWAKEMLQVLLKQIMLRRRKTELAITETETSSSTSGPRTVSEFEHISLTPAESAMYLDQLEIQRARVRHVGTDTKSIRANFALVLDTIDRLRRLSCTSPCLSKIAKEKANKSIAEPMTASDHAHVQFSWESSKAVFSSFCNRDLPAEILEILFNMLTAPSTECWKCLAVSTRTVLTCCGHVLCETCSVHGICMFCDSLLRERQAVPRSQILKALAESSIDQLGSTPPLASSPQPMGHIPVLVASGCKREEERDADQHDAESNRRNETAAPAAGGEARASCDEDENCDEEGKLLRDSSFLRSNPLLSKIFAKQPQPLEIDGFAPGSKVTAVLRHLLSESRDCKVVVYSHSDHLLDALSWILDTLRVPNVRFSSDAQPISKAPLRSDPVMAMVPESSPPMGSTEPLIVLAPSSASANLGTALASLGLPVEITDIRSVYILEPFMSPSDDICALAPLCPWQDVHSSGAGDNKTHSHKVPTIPGSSSSEASGMSSSSSTTSSIGESTSRGESITNPDHGDEDSLNRQEAAMDVDSPSGGGEPQGNHPALAKNDAGSCNGGSGSNGISNSADSSNSSGNSNSSNGAFFSPNLSHPAHSQRNIKVVRMISADTIEEFFTETAVLAKKGGHEAGPDGAFQLVCSAFRAVLKAEPHSKPTGLSVVKSSSS